jgi:hypothetical protein
MTATTDTPGLDTISKALGLKVKENGEVNGVANGEASRKEEASQNGEIVGDSKDKPQTEKEEKTAKVEETAAPGSISTVKNIYKSKKDDDGNWTWVNDYPEDAAEAAENDETEKFALVVRNKKSQDSRKKLEADSIVIQSPWLKKALGEILRDYPGVTCELKRLVFDAPFKPFVHRWADFLKFQRRKSLDETTKDHLKLLHDILKYEIGDTIKAFEDFIKNGVIDFENLWMIFQ